MKTIRRVTELPRSGSVYIFGAGGGGQIIQRILKKNPMIKIIGFIDNGKSGFLNGLRVYKFSEFIEEKMPYDHVLIASIYYPEISKQLKEANIPNIINAYSVCQNEAWERRRTIRAMITAGVLLLIFLSIFWL